MDITNYLQEFNKLTFSSDKVKYVKSLTDDNIKLELLKYIEGDLYKPEIIMTIISEKLRVEGIKKLSDDWGKINVVKTLTDDQLKFQTLSFISNESKKFAVIQTIKSEELRLEAIKSIGDIDKETVKTFTDEKLKLEALSYLKNVNDKNEIAKTLTKDNLKLEVLSFFPDDIYKTGIIQLIQSEKLRLEGAKQLTIDFSKRSIVLTLTDDQLKFESLSFIFDDYYKSEIISTIKSEKLRLEGIEKLVNDAYKSDIAKTLTDEQLKLQSLLFISDDYKKNNVIETIKSEELRFESIKELTDDAYKRDIAKTLTDDMLKLKSLPFISNESRKVEVIDTIGSEKLRLEGIKQLMDDDNKGILAQTLADDQLKFQTLSFISSERVKAVILKKIKNEELRLQGIKELTESKLKFEVAKTLTYDKLKLQSLYFLDYFYKKDIIKLIENEELRLEGIKTLKNDDLHKAELVLTLTDDKLKFQSLPFLFEGYKFDIIKLIESEELRFESIKLLASDRNKSEIAKTLTDELKLQSLIFIYEEYRKQEIIQTIENEELKLEGIKVLEDDERKMKIASTFIDDKFKIITLAMLKNIHYVNEIIEKINNTSLNQRLNEAYSKKDFSLLAEIVSDTIKDSGLDCEKIIKIIFESGSFECLHHFNKELLEETLDDKQLKVLEEYSNINNIQIRKIYGKYISTNYDKIDIEKIDKIAQLLCRIEMSNSSELQSFSDIIASEVLKHDNPLEYFSKIEDIFVRNHIPYVGKVFEVFKLLHTNSNQYKNYSPLLNRFKGNKYETQMIDLIIFNDLLKCAFGSNNRSLRNFLNDIENGNHILVNVINTNDLLNRLNDNEKSILIKYLESIEITLDGYDKWKNNKVDLNSNDNILSKIDCIVNRLKLTGNNCEQIPDILIRKLCGVSGIDTFEKAKKYFDSIIYETDKRNREKSKYPFILEEGDFVKGINNFKYLSRILQNGSVAQEFLGDSANSDATPLDTDLSRILSKDVDGNKSNELGKIIGSTISRSFGNIWFVLKNDPDKLEITRDSSNIEKNHDLSPKFSKVEVFKTLSDDHYGIRTGFPTSDIDYIVSREHFDRIGLEIAMNGFYIPVVNVYGELEFTPNDYDILRSKMVGLSYYGENNYVFSNNLVNEDIILIAQQIEQSNIETKRKRELINLLIKDSLSELGLKFKDKIDGDLSEGTVEVIDTGSTGRGTNKPGDGDFDFMMRLDKSILLNSSKMVELKKCLLRKLGKENSSELTSAGDFRLKEVKLEDGTIVDIDITFTGKTDKISYSTDMSLQERLSNIYNQDSQKYNFVVANILLAKQVLKQGEVYKPNRGEIAQGGLGGVGIENWVLQNGGSFIDAAKSFVEASKGKSFEEFKNTYYIWDFGENHMAERRGQYAHDNFVSNNMSESGYNKMIQVLNEYINKYELNDDVKLGER